MKKIYVADDDKNICRLLKSHIESEGYKVETFFNGQELLSRFKKSPCDLIITDIVMPELNGYELCKEIRKTSMLPVFMISANNDEIDRVLGLELGSDDYISKPISFRELTIKIRNVFRRLETNNTSLKKCNQELLVCYDLKLDIPAREAYVNDTILQTTAKEFDLLQLFLENINRAFSRDQIIEKIWGYDYLGDSRQVDNMIKRLRKKMLVIVSQCQIQTVWGYGYKIGDHHEKQD